MSPVAAPRRRLSPEDRRAQLVATALPIVAERGAEGLSLEEVAATAGVSRNLLYHYFPRGRSDLYHAVVDRACEELAGVLAVDPGTALSEKLPANLRAYLDLAEHPTPAFVVARRAAASADPAVERTVQRARSAVAAGIALNHLGTAEPPPLVRQALRGYIAFAEEFALQWLEERGAPRSDVERTLSVVLLATVRAAQGAHE